MRNPRLLQQKGSFGVPLGVLYVSKTFGWFNNCCCHPGSDLSTCCLVFHNKLDTGQLRCRLQLRCDNHLLGTDSKPHGRGEVIKGMASQQKLYLIQCVPNQLSCCCGHKLDPHTAAMRRQQKWHRQHSASCYRLSSSHRASPKSGLMSLAAKHPLWSSFTDLIYRKEGIQNLISNPYFNLLSY